MDGSSILIYSYRNKWADIQRVFGVEDFCDAID